MTHFEVFFPPYFFNIFEHAFVAVRLLGQNIVKKRRK